MHRIDGPGAASGGFFTEGDPTTGTPATVVTDDFMNAIQEELVAVATSAGAPLNKPSNDQVITAIRALIAASVPAGMVAAFARYAGAPSGWLVADGSQRSRTTYPALWAAIGTTFGAGDGSTTFNLPDLRGEFIRGWDGARGVDPGRAFASAQGDDLRSHSHGASTTAVGDHKHWLAGDADSSDPLLSAGNMAVQKTSGTNSEYRLTNTAAEASLGLSSAAGGHSHGVSVSATGGAETRPRNVALLYCIKV